VIVLTRPRAAPTRNVPHPHCQLINLGRPILPKRCRDRGDLWLVPPELSTVGRRKTLRVGLVGCPKSVPFIANGSAPLGFVGCWPLAIDLIDAFGGTLVYW
jgi:hypothetical protein